MTFSTMRIKAKPGRCKWFPRSVIPRRPPGFFFFVILVVCFHFYTLFRYKHAITPLDGWPEHVSRNVSYYIGTEVKKFPSNLCKYPTTLLIMVHSTPDGKESRDAIRQTWGNRTTLMKHNTSLYFLIGENEKFDVRRRLSEENQQHHDLIVEDFIDTYSNLTLKSITMVKLFRYRSQCQYLLKADEDVFVNIENVVMRITKWKLTRKLLLGRLVSGERRKNDYYKQWYAPRYMYLPHKYPPFLAGPAYLMSLETGRELYKTALELPLFHLEDVFLTGICAERAGIERVNDRHFTDYGIPHSKCMRIKLVSAHSFPPKRLRDFQQMYLKVKANNRTCKPDKWKKPINLFRLARMIVNGHS